jgi:diguanylate cyclase (GGDEF)-like protein
MEQVVLVTSDRATPVGRERSTAFVVAGFGIGIAALTVVFGASTANTSSAIPSSLISAAVVTMIVTAALLRYFYQASSFPPHAILGIAFACTGGLLVPYAFATIEAASSPDQSTVASQLATWLWLCWHTLFVLLIGAYVFSEGYFTRRKLSNEDEHVFVRTFATIAVVTCVSSVLLLVLNADSLPQLLTKAGAFTPLFHVLSEDLLLALCAAVCVFLMFKTRLNKNVHLWLAVVLVLFACEVFVNGHIAQRAFSSAWYAGLAEGLAWQSVLLIVLLRRAHEQFAQFVANNRSLAKETIVDPLTGLLNRRGFDVHYQEALAEAHITRAPVALLTLDLDNFKAYNDHFGHVAGDEALRAVGRAIESVASRPQDVSCRIGGEEFAVVLPRADEAGATTVAERIRSAILQLRLKHAPTANSQLLSISIGVAISDGTLSALMLRERSDAALYRAKQLGRNRVNHHCPGERIELRAV